MTTLTLKFGNNKPLEFKFGQGIDNFAITGKDANIIRNIFNASKNGIYTAESQAEFSEINDFLTNADANGDKVIDSKDYTDLRSGKVTGKGGIFAEGSEDYDAINKKKKDGNYYSIFTGSGY